jgi:hypothetical protein
MAGIDYSGMFSNIGGGVSGFFAALGSFIGGGISLAAAAYRLMMPVPTP